MKLNKVSGKFKRALIIGSGQDVPEQAPAVGENALIIAADGGLLLAQKWNLIPDRLIGDFDSLNIDLIDLPEDLILRYPVEKDKTDLELAVDYALQWGIKEIILTGAWGTGISHSLGNLELMYFLAQNQVQAQIITRSAWVYTVNQLLELKLPLDSRISLVPLSEQVTGVSTSGLYYPLNDAVINKGSTWTIGNKTSAECIQITCGSGILIAVVELKNPR